MADGGKPAGASLSPATGGGIAQMLGYRRAFFISGSLALASLALWPACAAGPGAKAS